MTGTDLPPDAFAHRGPEPACAAELYRAFWESATDGVCLVSEDGLIIYTNPAQDSMYGCRAGELINRHIATLSAYPEAQSLRRMALVARHVAAKGQWKGEWRHCRKDGTSFIAACHVSAFRADDVSYWLCITGQAQASLRRCSSQLQAITEAALVIAQAPTLDEKLKHIVRAARQIIGARRSDISLATATADGPLHPMPAAGDQLAAPLIASTGRSLGQLRLYGNRKGTGFDAVDEALLGQLAQLASASIEQAQVSMELREREAELATEVSALRKLQEVSTLLLRDDTADAIFDHILTAAVDLMSADCASIQMLDPESGTLRLLGFRGFHAASAEAWRLVDAVSESTCGAALRNSGRVVIPDVETCEAMAGSADLEAYRRSRIRGVQSTPLLSRSGELVGMISTHWRQPHTPSERDLRIFDLLARQAADAIERKAAEEALRIRGKEFETLADNIPALCWMADADGNVHWYNERWYHYSGASFADIKGWGWTALVAAEVRPLVMKRWQHSVATGEPFEMTFPIKSADGAYRPFLTRGVPIHDTDRRIIRWFGTNVDVQEQVEVERVLEQRVRERTRELRHANARLEAEMAERERAETALRQAQKMQAVGQLAGGIAHDFNNLLGAIVGSLDLMRRQPDDPERVRRFTSIALQAAERGTRLTGQLLAFARVQRIEQKPLHLHDLFTNLRDLLGRMLGPMVQLTLDLDPEPAMVLSDQTQIEMAILNLAINARDAMPDGGHLTIATRPWRSAGDAELAAGDYIELAVTDTGCGMAPDVAARAFEPFFTTKDVGQGTGLGLAQVYSIARQSGGTARLESRPGGGTTVRLYLPRTDLSVDAAQRRGPKRRAEAGEPAMILVVDDDPDLRRVLVASLEAFGFGVIEAPDGPTALSLLASAQPDLLLVDFAMPGMNGAKLADAARRLQPDLPVVFVSGYADTAAIEKLVGPEASVLRKPFLVDELEDMVAAALNSGPE